MSDEAIEEMTEILRRSHKIKDGDENDFTIRSQQEMMDPMSSTMDGITLILVVAAAFSLLVAGIGIMNIMLVSVTERTKEIGLRMSVGARGIDIMLQFLIESIMISLTGAFLGVALGYGGSYLAKTVLMMPCSVPFWSVWLSFAVCAFIGIFFGYLPARKAAMMDPIEAIRYE
jgi:putative ABC transport system permease protein